MDKIAVLIPCYNESRTIEKVVTDFKRVLPEATIYVYDNNSTDGTDELARGAGATVQVAISVSPTAYLMVTAALSLLALAAAPFAIAASLRISIQ